MRGTLVKFEYQINECFNLCNANEYVSILILNETHSKNPIGI